MAEHLTDEQDVREVVRERYAAAARAATNRDRSCCAPERCTPDKTPEDADSFGPEQGEPVFGGTLYSDTERDELPDEASLASMGCGNPTAVAELGEGDAVLDLGSGGGIDVLLSARRVGPSGTAYGLDMTDEMLDLARENQRQAGVDNVEWLKGHIEDIPLPDAAVDVVISNCVINLSSDKRRVLAEAARVLRAGGRFAVSDVIADPDMDERTRRDVAEWTGCIAGALTREAYEADLASAGFEAIEIVETHRVHEHASSAIVRARKPAGDG